MYHVEETRTLHDYQKLRAWNRERHSLQINFVQSRRCACEIVDGSSKTQHRYAAKMHVSCAARFVHHLIVHHDQQ